MNNIEVIKEKLNKMLLGYAKEFPSQGIIFSGGLDSSIAALLYKSSRAINVSLEDYSTDLTYAKTLEQYLGIKVEYIRISIKKALNEIPNVIKILKSFDPAIPNDLAAYFAVSKAKELGLKSIATGDGADELFGGYEFMQNIEDLESYINRISKNMSFSSNVFAECFKMDIRQPFIVKEIVSLATEDIDVSLKIKKDKEKIWGKWILRKSFEGSLPDEIIWQSKRPLEIGSGMTRLREIISEKVSDSEFGQKTKDYDIQFINKEHLYYYEIYKDIFGKVPVPQQEEISCPGCKTGMQNGSFHCRVCGWVRSLDES